MTDFDPVLSDLNAHLAEYDKSQDDGYPLTIRRCAVCNVVLGKLYNYKAGVFSCEKHPQEPHP